MLTFDAPTWSPICVKSDRRARVCRRCVRRRLLRHGGVPCRVLRGRSDHHEKGVVRTTEDRAMRRDRSRIHRLLQRRPAGRRPALLGQESLRNPRPGRGVWKHAALSQGAQDVPGSQLRVRSRYVRHSANRSVHFHHRRHHRIVKGILAPSMDSLMIVIKESMPLPSNRHHRSNDDCLEVKPWFHVKTKLF